jgi:hypothetical protein
MSDKVSMHQPSDTGAARAPFTSRPVAGFAPAWTQPLSSPGVPHE